MPHNVGAADNQIGRRCEGAGDNSYRTSIAKALAGLAADRRALGRNHHNPVIDVKPTISATRVKLCGIATMRDAYRREMSCQIVHDSYHEREFMDSYLLTVNGDTVGYASVSGPQGARDIVKEFYVYPEWRGLALPLFQSIIAESRATWIEAQTNDLLLSIMLWDCATDVTSETILFADAMTTCLPAPSGTTLRKIGWRKRRSVFLHTTEPVGDWGLEQDGHIVATGGLFFHYNKPYGDIYMEVAAAHHRQGLGSYLVQELKRIAREAGHTPSARTDRTNLPSRFALQRAGMFPCARILRGRLAA